MKNQKPRAYIPIYAFAVSWIVCAFFIPMYTLAGLAGSTAVSAAAAVVAYYTAGFGVAADYRGIDIAVAYGDVYLISRVDASAHLHVTDETADILARSGSDDMVVVIHQRYSFDDEVHTALLFDLTYETANTFGALYGEVFELYVAYVAAGGCTEETVFLEARERDILECDVHERTAVETEEYRTRALIGAVVYGNA